MPVHRSLSTGRLLAARSTARLGLLLSVAATIAVAVATGCMLLAWLGIEIARARTAVPPGADPQQVADDVDRGVSALLAAAPALVVLVALLAATATAQLGRLLASARESESATLRARGASRRQLLAADAGESVGVALGAFALGLLLSVGVLGLGALRWTGEGGGADAAFAALRLWWVAAASALVLGGVFVLSTRRRPAGGRVRGARGATVAVVVLVVLASALVLWQLRLARSAAFDPIVAVAPTVLLMAAALLALAAFGALAAAVAVPAGAPRGLAPAYPMRQIVRRLPIYAVAVLLVALTVAQAVFASAHGGTWAAAATGAAAVRAGTDLRVDLGEDGAAPAMVADAAAVAGVDAAAPALLVPVEIGTTEAELVALPPSALDSVISGAGGRIDRGAIAQGVAPGDGTVQAAPLPLGAAASGLRVTASADSTRENLEDLLTVRATVRDATGTPVDVQFELRPAGESEAGRTLVGEAALPEGTAPWDLLSVTASSRPTPSGSGIPVRIDGLQSIGGEQLDVVGADVLGGDGSSHVLWLADGGAPRTPDDPDAEAPGEAPELPAVRVALSAALAERLALSVGETIDFRYTGTGRRGALEVGAIVEAVPGASVPLAIFAPLDALHVSMLQRGTSLVRPNSVWAAGDASADAALSAALGDRAVATSGPGVTAAIVGALVPGWWIATAGSAVLSLIAAFAIVQTLTLARRRELGVLRALGVTRGRQALLRAVELAAVLGSALVLGAAAGALVAWAVVPELVRAVTPGIQSSPGVTFDAPPLAVVVVALVVGLAVIVGVAASGVRRAASRATVGEEAR